LKLDADVEAPKRHGQGMKKITRVTVSKIHEHAMDSCYAAGEHATARFSGAWVKPSFTIITKIFAV